LLLVLQDLPEFKSFKRPDEQHDWAVERLLRRYANEVERTENNVILSGEGVVSEDIKTNYQVVGTSMEEAIQRVFSMASHMTWQSFVKNRLPLLRLPSDVIVAIQSGKLEYTKARKIGQLKSEEERQTLLQEAIDEGLSLAEVSERVKAYKSRGGPDKLDDLSTRSRAITKAFKQNPALAHKAKVKKAQRLLSELENLLGICHTD
jgi:ParB family chromosome partitioning protein